MKSIQKLKPMTYNRYLRTYQLLNSPDKVTSYVSNGCFMMYRDGEPILAKQELEQYQREEKENPLNKHWYELKFVPFKMFELREIFNKGSMEFNHINKC